MLTVYGSEFCPDCIECKANFDAHSIEYSYIDINDSMQNLKEFLRLRDTLEIFSKCRYNGTIGIPAIISDDGTVTLDWKDILKSRRLSIVFKEARALACRINDKSC